MGNTACTTTLLQLTLSLKRCQFYENDYSKRSPTSMQVDREVSEYCTNTFYLSFSVVRNER